MRFQVFNRGDQVKVIGGAHSGQVGTIEDISPKQVPLLGSECVIRLENTDEHITCYETDLEKKAVWELRSHLRPVVVTAARP